MPEIQFRGLPAAACAAFAFALSTAAGDAPAPRLDVTRASFGASYADGLLRAGGPDWKAAFEPAGPVFTPALGEAVATAQGFALRLESVGRGRSAEAGAEIAAAVAPSLDGSVVSYERAPWLVERYEVRREGLEQSFELTALPPGRGDLVLRLALETPLPLPAAAEADGSLSFVLPEVGGVRVGAVTAIDAAGRTRAGALRLDGGALELVVPADFVDRAALPLVIDPLIGALLTVGSGFADEDPDVAYDVTSDRYLVVWRRVFSAFDHAVRGQLVTGSGVLAGGLLAIKSDATALGQLAVANNNLTDSFLVVWNVVIETVGDAIVGRTVVASSGALSAGAPILAPGHHAVLGSETTTSDNEVLMAFVASSSLSPALGVRVAQVTVPGAGGAPSTLGTTTITTDTDDHVVAISRSGGSVGRYLVAWHTIDSTPFGDDGDISGAVVDRNTNLLTPVAGISTALTVSDVAPACDGDGTRWVVAYSTLDLVSGLLSDLVARTVVLSAGALVPGSAVTVDGSVNESEFAPAVGYTGEEAVIAWTNQTFAFPSTTSIRFATVDLFNSADCSAEGVVDVGSSEGSAVIGTEYSGNGALPADAMLVWDAGSGTEAQRYTSDTGLVVNLGGGCTGGTALAPCAVEGNGTFVHRLMDAPVSVQAFLVIGFETIDLGCGTCRLVPNPFSGIVLAAGTTGSFGIKVLAMPIPASADVVGLSFIDQWIVDTSPGTCAALGVSMSNAIQVTIQ